VRFTFIEAQKESYPVSVLGSVLRVSRTGYYAWASRAPSARAQTDAQWAEKIRSIFHDSRRSYGSRRVVADLRAQGHRVGRSRVQRLMRQQGLIVRKKRRFVRTTDSRHDLPIANNLLGRDFETPVPNRVWV
jgi:putative transposase